MICVRRHPVAGHLGEDLGPPSQGVVEVLQDEHRTPLSHHESVAVGVEGPRRTLRVVVARGESPGLGECGDAEGRDRGLGSAGDHHVGGATTDQLGTVADGVGGSRAGGDDARDRSQQIVLDRSQPGRHVGDDTRDTGGAHPIRAALVEDGYLLDERAHPTEARPDHHAGPRRLGVVLGVGDPRLFQRLTHRDQEELGEAVDSAHLSLLEVLLRLPAGDLGRDRRPIALGVEEGDLTDTGPPGQHRLPGGTGILPDRSDRPEPGDDHPSSLG